MARNVPNDPSFSLLLEARPRLGLGWELHKGLLGLVAPLVTRFPSWVELCRVPKLADFGEKWRNPEIRPNVPSWGFCLRVLPRLGFGFHLDTVLKD